MIKKARVWSASRSRKKKNIGKIVQGKNQLFKYKNAFLEINLCRKRTLEVIQSQKSHLKSKKIILSQKSHEKSVPQY